MDILKEAGLNTLLGMGTTFIVLIVLSLIIYLFGKLLNRGAALNKTSAGEKDVSSAQGSQKPFESQTGPGGILSSSDPSAAQASGRPGQVPSMAPDGMPAAGSIDGDYIAPEILAVISAAVAAAEGKAGVSGFEVRKIRKSRRHIA